MKERIHLDQPLAWFVIITLMFIAMTLGAIAGSEATKGKLHDEAVERGYGEWYENERGYSDFRWK